ncbi:ABC transporter permease [Paenibacillus piscarius]|uniref:ABC transporter permease n=1 Tax=Paenibacillus piscarius TaxID=1089681 RepID=UPI001EE795F0|nr:ABC transporter permease [Paenibacillus piscarius]
MLNLMKSEQYRFVRTKNYYYYGLLCAVLMVAAAITLMVFHESVPDFPYGNERFFYRNVLSMMPVVFALLSIFTGVLMGDNKHVLKNTVAYGFSRRSIYTAKLLVTLAGFLLFAFTLVGISVLLGSKLLFRSYEYALTEYCQMLLGMLPIMIAGVTTYFCINAVMNKNAQISTVFLLIYFLPYMVLSALKGRFTWAAWLYSHSPAYYLFNAYDVATYPAWEPWVTGMACTLFFYVLGLYLFRKEEF